MSELVTPHGENRRNPAAALNALLKGQGGIPVVHAGKIVLPDDFPGTTCPACTTSLQPGDFVTLVPVGPGPDPDRRRAARMSAPFDVASLIVCWPCVSGEEQRARIVAPDGGEPAPVT